TRGVKGSDQGLLSLDIQPGLPGEIFALDAHRLHEGRQVIFRQLAKGKKQLADPVRTQGPSPKGRKEAAQETLGTMKNRRGTPSRGKPLRPMAARSSLGSPPIAAW